MTSFQEKVLQIVSKIPKGKVATYGQIASLLGSKNAFRAVGNALNRNPKPITIPCHRVVKKSGIIGGYKLGQKRKAELLKMEKVEFTSESRVNLEKHLWKPDVK